jgi:predicted phosphodiesterase
LKRIVLIPDTHIPSHDKRIVRSLIKFIGDYQPDEVVHIGDLMDYPAPSRWSKDTREEFETSVFEESVIGQTEFLEPLRNAYSGPIGVIAGNHDTRPGDYLRKYAPALGESKAFDLEVLLNFPEYDIRLLPDFYDVAPGWVATHGHKGGIRLNQTAGLTALNAAKKIGKSVAMGHVHRWGLVAHTIGYPGAPETEIFGLECGHITNPSLMDYTKGTVMNWQTGFGMLYVDGTTVHPKAVKITGNKFVVEGETYSVK